MRCIELAVGPVNLWRYLLPLQLRHEAPCDGELLGTGTVGSNTPPNTACTVDSNSCTHHNTRYLAPGRR